MNNKIPLRVIIAGAGIAGLSTAIAFRKIGYDVVVVERTQSLGAVGAGILIQANGLLVLDAIGLGNAVRSAGISLESFGLHDRHGRQLLRADFDLFLPPKLFPVSIHRAELHRILWEECESSGVSLRLGYKVTHVDTEGMKPALICETEKGTQSISGELIIGADGVKSTIRDTGGFEFQPQSIIEGSVQGVADFPIPKGFHGEYFSRGEACGMLPLGGQKTFWFWGGSGKTVDVLENVPFAHWKACVCERFSAMKQVLDGQREWDGTVRLLHCSIRCKSWSRGNVVLIGDAAHAMSPNLGQGANCALVDALSLACHVAAMSYTSDFTVPFERFEHERRSLVEALQSRGHQEGFVGTLNLLGADFILKLILRLSRFSSKARRNAEIRMMSGLEGDGFDLSAAGIHLPLPW